MRSVSASKSRRPSRGDDDLAVQHAALRQLGRAARRPARGSSGSAACRCGCRSPPRRRPGRRSPGSRPTWPRTACRAGSSRRTWRASASRAASPADPCVDSAPDMPPRDMRGMRPTRGGHGRSGGTGSGRSGPYGCPTRTRSTSRERGYTKLDMARYYLAVGDGITARAAQPAHHPGALPGRGDRRVVLPEAGPQEPPRLDPDRPHHLPQRPVRRRDVPDRAGRRALGGQPRRRHLPPVARAPRRHRPPRRAAHRPRPAARHRLRRRRRAPPHELRDVLDELGCAAGRRPPAGAGCTSSCRSSRDWTFTQVRRAAIALGRRAGTPHAGAGDHRVVEGGARRADLRRLQPDRPRPHHRLRLLRTRPRPHAPVSAPLRWDEIDDVAPRRLRPARPCPRATPRSATCTPDMDDHALRPGRRCWSWPTRDEADHGLGDLPYPPEYPKMPGEPKRVQPSRAKKHDAPGAGPRLVAGPRLQAPAVRYSSLIRMLRYETTSVVLWIWRPM